MNPTRLISLTQAAKAAVCFSLLVFSPVTTHAAPDAAQVAGDLQVDGIHFSSDGSVQTKASPWGYGAPNGVDIGIVQGKVGIGTLTPSTELDVVGTVKATQLLGGANSTASGAYSTVSGGNTNTASGPRSTVSGGDSNTASADYSTVSGGFSNTASGSLSAVGGGYFNIASVGNSVVSGGSQNRAKGANSVVSGGYFNVASGGNSVVSGGYGNEAGGDGSWAGGFHAKIRNATAAGNTTGDQGTFLWSDANIFNFNSTKSNEFAVRATGGVRFVTAIDGSGNPTQTTVIAGNGKVGIGTLTPSTELEVVGTVKATQLTGGIGTTASGQNSTVSGGNGNLASGSISTVSGGYFNTASGGFSTVSGGFSNTASGLYSVVSGGTVNEAGGDYSWAGGKYASVRNATAAGNSTGDQGTFLWSDANNSNFYSTKSNEFAVRATGGVRFVTAIDASGNPTRTTVIDGNGYVGIGNTAPNSPLIVTAGNLTSGALWSGTANVNGFEVGGTGADRYVGMKRDGAANTVLHISKSDAGGGKLIGFFVNGGYEVGGISATATATYYNNNSDARLKENIRPTAFGVEDLMKLEVKDYTFKADTNGTVLTGFLAQDLYRVIPQAVSVGGDDPATNPWQVDYGKLTPFLVKAVQELKTRNDALQAENEANKANYDAMKTDYNAMKERMERVEKLLAAMKP